MERIKIAKFVISTLIVQILIISCNEKKKSEIFGNSTILFYKNGHVKSISIINDSTLHSQTVYFNPIGSINSIEEKKDSLSEGQTIWFYNTGNIRNTVIYRNGKLNGAAFMFYEDGSIQKHRYWKDDKRVGYATDFIQDSIGTLNNIYYFDNDTVIWVQPTIGKGITIKHAVDSSSR